MTDRLLSCVHREKIEGGICPVPAGTSQTIVFGGVIKTIDAGRGPKVTVVLPLSVKKSPVIVTGGPPKGGPPVGRIDVTAVVS